MSGPNIISQTTFYDPFNHGWAYFVAADDGTFWIRSVLGKWAQIDPPSEPSTVSVDFATYIVGTPGGTTLAQIDTDNKGGSKDTIA